MSDIYRNRQGTIQTLFLIAAIVLIGKAMQLQVLDGTFRTRADATAIDKFTVYPARGLIYDRRGRLMVYNDPMYDLLVTYNRIDPEMDTMAFCNLLGIGRDYFEETLKKDWKSGRFSKSVPFVFLSKISPDRFASFQENLYRFPGFFAQLRNARGYPHQNAAHLIGYIREVNRQEVERSKGVYVAGDYIGASGMESSYEDSLRGKKGVQFILKDNLGREVGPYKNGDQDTIPETGVDLISSIDLELQAYGEKLMQHKIGGIVALEPKTGEILAMISSPTYDPNLLTISSNERGKTYSDLNTDSLKPFLNRAVMAQYPPGSLFKTVVALVGLQEGLWPENRAVPCHGGYSLGGGVLTGCHNHPTCTNVSSAIQHSCNAYFVTMFRTIVDQHGFYKPVKGLQRFNDYLDRFGLGRPLGVDFPSEQRGNYPTVDYYGNLIYKGENWNSIWIRSLGIGQGELLATNLQLVNLAATIANRGYYIIPHLVKDYRNTKHDIPLRYREKHYVGIERQHFETVIRGMEGAVLAGTARRAAVPGIQVCGKTGTAENPHGEDHSIFFCFAPMEDPKIAIAVYIENAGFGGTYAAPIASLLIEKYLTRQISEERKPIEERLVETNLLNVKKRNPKR